MGRQSTRASCEGSPERNLMEAPLLALISFTPAPPLPGRREGGREEGREGGREGGVRLRGVDI